MGSKLFDFGSNVSDMRAKLFDLILILTSSLFSSIGIRGYSLSLLANFISSSRFNVLVPKFCFKAKLFFINLSFHSISFSGPCFMIIFSEIVLVDF